MITLTDDIYLSLIYKVLSQGEDRMDRTGVGTRSLFSIRQEVSHNVTTHFPLVSVKRTNFKSVVREVLWMLRSETNVNTLGCGIWDAWAGEDGELGPIYGAQWRNWQGIDQVANLVQQLKDNPTSRRHIVSAWNVGDLDKMALVPCHMFWQCYVSNDGHLDMQVYQRSCDQLLGQPFNWAGYALIMLMLAHETGLKARRLIFDYGDLHIYKNHEDVARRLCETPIAGGAYGPCPVVELPRDKHIPLLHPDRERWYNEDDFKLWGYQPGPYIKLEVAV